MHEFDFRRRRINVQAIIAFVLGVVVAYLISVQAGFGGGGIFVTLVVVAVGGFWYHLRKVI
jgi:hypothetical protein